MKLFVILESVGTGDVHILETSWVPYPKTKCGSFVRPADQRLDDPEHSRLCPSCKRIHLEELERLNTIKEAIERGR